METLSGTAYSLYNTYSRYDVSWHFEENEGEITLYIDVEEHDTDTGDFNSEAHYELKKVNE